MSNGDKVVRPSASGAAIDGTLRDALMRMGFSEKEVEGDAPNASRRAWLISEGKLIDLMDEPSIAEMVKSLGFRAPVAVTGRVFDRCLCNRRLETNEEAAEVFCALQAMLSQLALMCQRAIARNPGKTPARVPFVATDIDNHLVLLIGVLHRDGDGGEAVVTIADAEEVKP